MENRKDEAQITAASPNLPKESTSPQENAFASWMDQQLILLEAKYHDFVTHDSQRSSVGR